MKEKPNGTTQTQMAVRCSALLDHEALAMGLPYAATGCRSISEFFEWSAKLQQNARLQSASPVAK